MNALLKVLVKTLEEHPELIFQVLQTILDMAKQNPEFAKELIAFVTGFIKK